MNNSQATVVSGRQVERRPVSVASIAKAVSFVAATVLFCASATANQESEEHQSDRLRNLTLEDCGSMALFQTFRGDWHLSTEFIDEAGQVVSQSFGSAEIGIALSGRGIQLTEWHNAPRQPFGVFIDNIVFVSECETGGVTGIAINTIGNRKQWDGDADENGYRFIQAGELFLARPGHNEVSFSRISDDYFIKTIRYCVDGGCTLNYRAHYRRLLADQTVIGSGEPQ